MWSRIELKDQAKAMLKKHYWKAFLVMLIATIVGANSSAPSIDLEYKAGQGLDTNFSMNMGALDWLLPTIAGIAVLAFAVAIIFKLFISNPIEVGKSRFFINTYEKEEVDAGDLSYAYRSNLMSIVKVMFMRNLYVFLWSLLFIIPGIIKSYAYKFVPYLLAENPDLDYDEALSMSQEMTEGHKMDMFVLDLSFIGWYILGSIALGIGVLFVHPYREATFAALYKRLKKEPVSDYYYAEDDYDDREY